MVTLFKENDIRPRFLDKGLRDEIKKDVNRLLSRKKDFIRVDCPACASQKYKKIFNKFGFDFTECQQCGTVFMNPRATKEILSDFYARSFVYKYWNKYIFPASEKTRKKRIMKPRLKRILDLAKKYNIKKDFLIEVGPGFGTFCEAAIESGKFKRVTAIEPSANLAKTCRAKGIEVIEKTIEEIEKLDSPPSIIVSFEVIEHLFSPFEYLESCYRLMGKESLIAVTCPNWQGFDILTLGPKSDNVDQEHINLFNPESLQSLFKRTGFEVLEIFTPGELDVDIVRNKVLQKKFDISGQPFIKNIILDHWEKLGVTFQEFLKTNRLSSHMWLVAIKK
jgi:2-polyprenyl-3-methyl-5-hydroxy-6-metoxy-1,4-benzoquinol methylase/ribosomal protein S27E